MVIKIQCFKKQSQNCEQERDGENPGIILEEKYEDPEYDKTYGEIKWRVKPHTCIPKSYVIIGTHQEAQYSKEREVVCQVLRALLSEDVYYNLCEDVYDDNGLNVSVTLP
jgi:hypothetical protein